MQICYLRSPDACIYTFTQTDLLGSLSDDLTDLWPRISLQLYCDETFDISGFNISPPFIVTVPDHGTFIIPEDMAAGSASFNIGWPNVVEDVDACICISNVCTKQGSILIRGVFELSDPVNCEPSTQSTCSFDLQSPTVPLSGPDSVVLVPRQGDISSRACLSTSSRLISLLTPFATRTDVVNNVSLLTRMYSISSVSTTMAGGDYLICYCAWESTCELVFPMYVGIFRVISAIKKLSLLPTSVVRINTSQFSIQVDSFLTNSIGNLTCAVGSQFRANSPSSAEVATCDFSGCIFVATNSYLNYFHFYSPKFEFAGTLFVYCFHTAFPCCVYPPSGYAEVSVSITSEASTTPLIQLQGYRDTPISFPPRISSMGQYGVSCGIDCSFICAIQSNSFMEYSLCFCDQIGHNNECMSWTRLGVVNIIGPSEREIGKYVMPGTETEFEIFGTGLETTDLLLVTAGIVCPRSSSQWNTTVHTNTSYAQFSYLVPPIDSVTYSVCWCPRIVGNECVIDPLLVQTVIAAFPIDCVMSAWTIVSPCSAACGGGTLQQSRSIVSNAIAGGDVCSNELLKTIACNVQLCPPPILRSVLSPTSVFVNESFWLVIAGENLRPNEDAVQINFLIRPCNVSSTTDPSTTVYCGNWTLSESGVFVAKYCSRSSSVQCSNEESFSLGNWNLFVKKITGKSNGSSFNGILVWVGVALSVALFAIVLIVVYTKKKRNRSQISTNSPPTLSAPSTPKFELAN